MKTIINFIKSKFFWFNLLAVVIVTLVIGAVVLLWTRGYTHHGEAVEVPDLTHMYIEEVEVALEDLGLSYEVVDSVYLRSFKPGEVAEQTPVANTLVKKGRKIYITLNCRQRQMVRVPNLIGESYRKAQSNLRALGFNADSVKYRPYEFNGEVLDMLCNNTPIREGDRLPDGSKIVLVVGQQDTENTVYIPNLNGLTYDEALEMIRENELSLGNVSYDVRPASDTERQQYRVFYQSPAPGTQVYRGKLIEIKLSRTHTSTASEEFF